MGGLNDRFAICNTSGALVYGSRFDHFWSLASVFPHHPQAEFLLLVTLVLNNVIIDNYTDVRASRVRSNGVTHSEIFEECESNVNNLNLINTLKEGHNG